MSQHSLIINFAAPPPRVQNQGDLVIEQSPWGSGIGRVTVGAIVAYMRAMVSHRQAPELDCGLGSNGGYSTTIFVYPTPVELAYQFAASRGELTGPTVSDVEISEAVQVSPPDTRLSLKYPALAVKSAELLGQGYDDTGAPITGPVSVSVSGNEVTLSRPLYGTVRVKYTVRAHAYRLTVDPIEGATENNHACTVYGRWNGGIRWKIMEPPPGADDNVDSHLPCGFGTGTGSADDLPERPVAPREADRLIEIDYCSQEQIKDEVQPHG